MEEDGAVAQFTAITGATLDIANQYLRLTDGNMQQAIELFFASDGVDLAGPTSTTRAPEAPLISSATSRPSGPRSAYEDKDGIVHVDSDAEESDGDEPEIAAYNSRAVPVATRPISAVHTPAGVTLAASRSSGEIDEDEAMARRLQEELYAGGDLGGGGVAEGIRAPMGRTTETLVGPESYDVLSDADEMHAAVLEQMRARQRPRPHGMHFQKNTQNRPRTLPATEFTRSPGHIQPTAGVNINME